MNLRDLQYLVAVAEQRHFGRAAEAVNVSQPTLSGQIRKLEAFLGVALFERDSRNVALTAAGEAIVGEARAALAHAAAIRDIANAFRDPLAGRFRLGIIASLGPFLAPDLLAQMGRDAPRLELVLHEGVTDALIAGLRARTLDAAVTATPADADLAETALFDEPFLLAHAPGDPLAAVAAPTLADIAQGTLLLLAEGHCLRDQALSLCGTGAVDARVEATSLVTLMRLAAQGRGTTLVPALAARLADGLALRALAGAQAYRRIRLVSRRATTWAGPMYLSIATTHQPATDLGYLLHKHPGRVHEAELAFGTATVFYPEASEGRCEAVLVLDVDPIGLVRGKGAGEGLVDQYVNDRPYAASSFLSVALARLLRTAMAGTARERPELAARAIPLEAVVTPLPARGGEALVRGLFEPLGWRVEVEAVAGPGAEASRYVTLRLAGEAQLSALLNHLYVLVPVLDDDKHYWVGEDEVAKLLARGEGWLAGHPERELIVRRYLSHRRSLAHLALKRLAPEAEEEEAAPEAKDAPEARLEQPLRLNDARLDAVVAILRRLEARSVADLGCGEGKLLARLVRERQLERVIGVDASVIALERAARRLERDRPGGHAEGRLSLLHGALTYRDQRLAGLDAATLVEVIEHLEPDRLPALARALFGAARPRHVVVTTPNAEYNALFPAMPAGARRHPDHRFEWTRAEFGAWVRSIEDGFGYRAEIAGIGAVDATHGAPTQMAVFAR